MNIRDFTTAKDRKKALEQELSISLSEIGNNTLDESYVSTHNCENFIGAIQIPLGVAGPLQINNTEYFVPLATTEGALVASVSRGCKAIMESDGASVSAFRIGTSRGVVFYTEDVTKGADFAQYVYKNKAQFNTIAQQSSKHITLLNIVVKTVGQFAFVRFEFDTQDAMGMNMVTIASENIAQVIADKTKTRCIAVAGNYDVDKKPSWLNFIRGRGWEVRADVVLSKKVLETILKTTAENMYETWLAKCMVGSAMSGSMGFNAHFANIVAALFIATGQDVAHVTEGSLGMTTMEVREENLYVSVYLPDLMVGTVGGGTQLATQKAALNVLGIVGGNTGHNATRLAEVTGATVLAGEISLIASLAEGSLVKAHEKLGRGKK